MKDLKDCKTLNDIARQEFGKANYTNREKCKKLLEENGINWKEWLDNKKIKEKKYCLQCGKELNTRSQTKFCSSSCAAKYNNSKRELSEEIRVKISHTLQKKNPDFNGVFKPLTKRSKAAINEKFNGEKRYCKNCGKELKGTKIDFCDRICHNEYNYKTYIERWKNGNEDGMAGKYGLSQHIRKYFFEKYKNKCQICGWGETNKKTGKIPLEVHHIDGDYTNNKEENLQLLCPNCHSLTETYKNANGHGRKGRNKYN
jgi:predicted HNH restriction endonuclease